MSEPTDFPMPSQEEFRNARHAGFDDSVAPLATERRDRLTAAHRPQDARREANVNGFYASVLGNED